MFEPEIDAGEALVELPEAIPITDAECDAVRLAPEAIKIIKMVN